jgi:hypothetical protein
MFHAKIVGQCGYDKLILTMEIHWIIIFQVPHILRKPTKIDPQLEGHQFWEI